MALCWIWYNQDMWIAHFSSFALQINVLFTITLKFMILLWVVRSKGQVLIVLSSCSMILLESQTGNIADSLLFYFSCLHLLCQLLTLYIFLQFLL